MLGREELEVLKTLGDELNTSLVDCESTEVWLDDETELIKKEQADKVMDAMEARIKELEGFCKELIKDCKWSPTTYSPAINGFETIVQCTNGKKRVASFRMFDMRWYDVNNGNKLNVVKWLWQPSMPSKKEEMKMPKVFEGKFETWTTEQKTEWALSDIFITPMLRQVIVELQAENERLKAELKQTEVQDQVVFDGLRKENAKLKCLALHSMSEYCFAKGTIICNSLEFTKQSIEKDREIIHKINIRDRWGEYFAESYRKMKKALMEGK